MAKSLADSKHFTAGWMTGACLIIWIGEKDWLLDSCVGWRCGQYRHVRKWGGDGVVDVRDSRGMTFCKISMYAMDNGVVPNIP